MRKRLLIFGLFVIGLLASTTTYAATEGTKFTVDGIRYEIWNSGSVSVVPGNFSSYPINLSIPETVTYEGTTYVVTRIDNSAFQDTPIHTLVIPKSVYYIGAWAFSGCYNLEEIIFPTSIGVVGGNAFKDCPKLKYAFVTNDIYYSSLRGLNPFSGFAGTMVFMPSSFIDGFFLGVSEDATIYAHRSHFEKIRKSYTGSNLFAVEDYVEMTELKQLLTRISFKVRPVAGSSSTVEMGDVFLVNADHSTTPLTAASDGTYTLENLRPDTEYRIVCNSKIRGTSVPIHYFLKTSTPVVKLTDITPTQTTITAKMEVSSDESVTPSSLKINWKSADKKGYVRIDGLIPGRSYSLSGAASYGNFRFYCEAQVTTIGINPIISGEAGPTSFTAEGSWTEGDAKIDAYGFATGIDVSALTNQRRYTMGGLDPETTTKIAFGVSGPWGAEWTDREFTTPALTWETPGATATSLSSARMMVETNCDAETGTGFEWRRIDAPELVPSTQAPCPVVDGRLVGSLRNLNPETYYKFRPYYTSASGKTYYGEWTGLFTGDANVYFEPEVRTFAESLTDKRTVRLAGYALAGSDDITEQGFQYRAVGKEQTKARAAEAWQSVAAKGIKMEATLDDLAYGTTYRYRAYAVTAKGTFYGDEREFSTEAESGIEEVINDTEEGLTVALRENPATGTAWVRVTGADAAEARYRLTSVSGATVAAGTLAADGTWQPVELTVPAGLYLLTVGDTATARTVRLVVR